MKQEQLRIGRWLIRFFFCGESYPKQEILDYLDLYEIPDDIRERVVRIMDSNALNSGFLFTNPKLHRAVMAVGPTTSGAEFIDTLVHEVHHLAVAIAQELDIELDSESPAYLAGDSARSLASTICQMGCACRD